jgi:hypothetical protein
MCRRNRLAAVKTLRCGCFGFELGERGFRFGATQEHLAPVGCFRGLRFWRAAWQLDLARRLRPSCAVLRQQCSDGVVSARSKLCSSGWASSCVAFATLEVGLLSLSPKRVRGALQETARRGGERENLRGDQRQEGRLLASVNGCFPEGVTLRSRAGRLSAFCNGKGGWGRGDASQSPGGARPCRWKPMSAAGVKQTRRGNEGRSRSALRGWFRGTALRGRGNAREGSGRCGEPVVRGTLFLYVL